MKKSIVRIQYFACFVHNHFRKKNARQRMMGKYKEKILIFDRINLQKLHMKNRETLETCNFLPLKYKNLGNLKIRLNSQNCNRRSNLILQKVIFWSTVSLEAVGLWLDETAVLSRNSRSPTGPEHIARHWCERCGSAIPLRPCIGATGFQRELSFQH